MKKIYVYAIMAMLCVLPAVALNVGDNVEFESALHCNKVIDSDLSDQAGLMLFSSYQIVDPDGIARKGSNGMTQLSSSNINLQDDFDVDKEGVWQFKTWITYLEFDWNNGQFDTNSGVCVNDIVEYTVNAVPVCGNGLLEGSEECDDGNSINEDGCSNICVSEFCGDGIVQSGLGEECDGNGPCDSSCKIIIVNNGPSFVLNHEDPTQEFILQDSYVAYMNYRGRTYGLNNNYGDHDNMYMYSKNYSTREQHMIKRSYVELSLDAIKNNPNFNGNVQQVLLNWTLRGTDKLKYEIYSFNDDWDEMSLNWKNQPCGKLKFGACKNNPSISGYIEAEDGYFRNNFTRDTIWTIDITSLVQDALDNNYDTLNLVFKLEDEGSFASQWVYMYTSEFYESQRNFSGTITPWTRIREPAKMKVIL